MPSFRLPVNQYTPLPEACCVLDVITCKMGRHSSACLAVWLFVALVLFATLSHVHARRYEPMRGRESDKERVRERETEREEREREQEHERGQPQIKLGQAQDILQSDGGRIRVWSEDIGSIRTARVGIGELELEQEGLLVPQYSDADKIAYVLQGHGVVGAVIPGAKSEFRRTYVRRVQKGDVISLPKGTVYWWYNEGNERHRVLCAGDTTFGVHPGRVHQFGLAGSKQEKFGSVLHGFSRETLATAWGVDEKTVEALLERQNDAGIVKAKQKIRIPELPEERREERRSREEAQNHEAGGFYFKELTYNTRPGHPDLFVENAGYIKLVDHHKLPSLYQVGFSALKVSLEKNAMCAPNFVRNAHQLIYFTRGNGRVQVASGDGQTVFDEDVREGTVLAIPQFFPSLKIAGDQGLEWINLLTSSGPSISFLAGRNSVYHGIPKQVIAAAFNVDEGQLRELGRDEEILFPPRESGRRERRPGDHKLQNQHGRKEEEQQKRQEREEEERRRREREQEEERKRREEEKREREEQERRRREQEQEERKRQEEERRRREEEEERRRRGDEKDLPAWALASLQLL